MIGSEPDRNASRTALGAARFRAVHLLLDEPPLILNDPLAARLLDPEAKSPILDDAERFRTPVSRAIRCDVLVRSRYAEDRLEDSVGRGTRQFVILGAGLDTFAYRQPPWAGDLHIVEVDHAASQRDKRDRLARAGIAEPPNVAYAAADLEADDLLPLLQRAGLNPAQPAFVACLGVLIYLNKEAVDKIVALTAGLAPGSQFVFTFSRPGASTGGAPRAGSVAAGVAAIGEPWQTRFEPETFAAALRAAGFSSVRFLFPDEVARLYLEGRSDGLRPASRSVLAEATV